LGTEPGVLPLLEDTLDLLWQKRQGRLLTQKAYDEVGGVTGALHGRADALIDACSPSEQQLARRLLVRLVSTSEGAALSTRRRVAVDKLRPSEPEPAADFSRVLDRMIAARLLVSDGEGPAQMVEVAHEAL